MHIIKTTYNTPEGTREKFIASIENGNPVYTSKKMMAQQFEDSEVESVLDTLHKNFGKTFTSEQV